MQVFSCALYEIVVAASKCIIRRHSRVVDKVNKEILKEKLFNHQKVDS